MDFCNCMDVVIVSARRSLSMVCPSPLSNCEKSDASWLFVDVHHGTTDWADCYQSANVTHGHGAVPNEIREN